MTWVRDERGEWVVMESKGRVSSLMPVTSEESSFLEMEVQRKDGKWVSSRQYPPDMSNNCEHASNETWHHYCAMMNSCDPENSYRLVSVRIIRSESREVVI